MNGNRAVLVPFCSFGFFFNGPGDRIDVNLYDAAERECIRY